MLELTQEGRGMLGDLVLEWDRICTRFKKKM